MQPRLGREATLVLYPKFVRQTQSLVLVDPLSYIATLDVIPYIQTAPGAFSPISAINGEPVALADPNVLKYTQSSPSLDPDKPMVFRRLKGNTNYRIYGKAFDAGNQQISLDDLSYVNIPITSDDAPRVDRVPVTVTVPVSFGATTSVKYYVDGAYDNFKGTLYNRQTPVAVSETSLPDPTFTFSNLQSFTDYQFVAETYQAGVLKASSSISLSVKNDNALPAVNTFITTPPYVVSTLAGSTSGSSDGMGTAAQFYDPYGIAIDATGNLYVTETSIGRICKITPDGMVTTIAGGRGTGYVEAVGTEAKFNMPRGIAVDANGYVYVAEERNHCVRKISPEGTVSTFAGNGTAGFNDALGSEAKFNYPIGVAVDAAGYVYVGDRSNNRIRKITPEGQVSTLASGVFSNLWGISVDATGNVYVGENGSHIISKVSPEGVVTTVVGNRIPGFRDSVATGALLNTPEQAVLDAQGNIYVADGGNDRIRKVLPNGFVTTIAGGADGFSDGLGTIAKLSNPLSIALDAAGNLYVVDSSNKRIRKIAR